MMSKADTHVHTFYSGTTGYGPLRFPESISSPEEQVDNARKNGLSVVCITDHSEVKGAFKAAEYGKRFDDIDVVVGDE
ncbi:MAG: PHP domain-containing protein, partial [Candidatus Methanomethylophilaceae archaeon]|nr:PHP domain-containing protein [Candidatus Methanomethylophilaceae archaeon]